MNNRAKKKLSKPDLSQKLTAKQEAFAQAIASGMNQSDAYRQAFNVRATTKPSTINEAASRVMANSKVATRVDELRKPAVEEVQMTIQNHLADLKALRDKADERYQTAAAIAAEMARGKVSGFYVEKTLGLHLHGDIRIPDAIDSLESARRVVHVLSLGEKRLLKMGFPELAKLLQVEAALKKLGIDPAAPFGQPVPEEDPSEPEEIKQLMAPEPEKPTDSRAADAIHFGELIAGSRTPTDAELAEQHENEWIDAQSRKHADEAQQQAFVSSISRTSRRWNR